MYHSQEVYILPDAGSALIEIKQEDMELTDGEGVNIELRYLE